MILLPDVIVAMAKSSIVLLIAIAAAQALRRQSASTRHLILAIGLFSALFLPVLGFVLPSWRPEIASATVVRLLELPRGHKVAAIPESVELPTPSSGNAVIESKTTASSQTAIWLWIWLAGSGIVAVRLLVGGLRLVWVSWFAKPVTEERWTHAAREIVHAFSFRRHVRLRSNPRAPMLGAWGVFRPEVLLPGDRESWPDERVRAVLGHELAHIRRHDWLVQMTAEIARAVFWFNPLYWIVCRRLRRESEQACDDAVLRLGIDGTAYAAHLLDLARALNHGDPAWTAILAMARTPNLERRFAAMMNSSVNRRCTTRMGAAGVILIAICFVAPLAVIRAAVHQPASIIKIAHQEPVVELMPAPMPAPAPAVLPKTMNASAAVAPAFPQSSTFERLREYNAQLVGQRGEEVSQQGVIDFVEAVNRVRYRAEFGRLSVQPGPAQTSTGSLSGVVTDQSGGALTGVLVTLQGIPPPTQAWTPDSGGPLTFQPLGEIARAISNEVGTFTFPQLSPGYYGIESTFPGFAPFRKEGITVKAGESVRQNVTMGVAPVSFAVSVNADAATPGIRSAAPPQSPVRLGGMVREGRLIQRVDPIYPATARNAGTEGIVLVQIVIGKDGTTQDVRAESVVATGERGADLASAAVEAVKQWRFEPYLLNGEPIDVPTTVSVSFKLTQ